MIVPAEGTFMPLVRGPVMSGSCPITSLITDVPSLNLSHVHFAGGVVKCIRKPCTGRILLNYLFHSSGICAGRICLIYRFHSDGI